LAKTTKEVAMFARKVSMHLKPNSIAEFTQKIEKDIFPLLRKQKGFQDEITCVNNGGKQAFGISLWDKAESAEAYNRGSYAEVAKMLTKFVDGPMHVETFDKAFRSELVPHPALRMGNGGSMTKTPTILIKESALLPKFTRIESSYVPDWKLKISVEIYQIERSEEPIGPSSALS
jgi:hypothetical protein